MSDPVSDLKRELLAAAERRQEHAVPARPSRRQWLERFDVRRGGRRRRVVVLLAAALVVSVGTASAIGSVRDFFLDRGFVGLPPQGATPSAPESGELVLHWEGRSATHAKPHPRGFQIRPLFRTWVYADGRMIWSREGSVPEGANKVSSGYLEQRLTPEAVELLRSEVVGLLDRSSNLVQTVADDPLPGPFDVPNLLVPPDSFGWGMIEVPRGDRLVRLRWTDEHRAVDGTIATPEQVSALRRVDALVTDPTSVLPSSAWAVREVRAYVPSHYAVCIDTSPPTDASELLSLLPARAADVLRGKSPTRSEDDVVEAREAGRIVVLGRSVTYCSKLATEEAREVAEAVSGLDRDPRFHNVVLAYRLAEGEHDWETGSIWFEPYFPHGQYTHSASG